MSSNNKRKYDDGRTRVAHSREIYESVKGSRKLFIHWYKNTPQNKYMANGSIKSDDMLERHAILEYNKRSREG